MTCARRVALRCTNGSFRRNCYTANVFSRQIYSHYNDPWNLTPLLHRNPGTASLYKSSAYLSERKNNATMNTMPDMPVNVPVDDPNADTEWYDIPKPETLFRFLTGRQE